MNKKPKDTWKGIASEESVVDIANTFSGAYGDRVNPAGVAKFTAPSGYYFFACTCRIDGSEIASCEKNVGGVISADATDSYIGVAMYTGEFHPFVNKIISVTLTGAADQLQYWLKRNPDTIE